MLHRRTECNLLFSTLFDSLKTSVRSLTLYFLQISMFPFVRTRFYSYIPGGYRVTSIVQEAKEPLQSLWFLDTGFERLHPSESPIQNPLRVVSPVTTGSHFLALRASGGNLRVYGRYKRAFTLSGSKEVSQRVQGCWLWCTILGVVLNTYTPQALSSP